MSYPISRDNRRTFDPQWAGEVFVCDVDRTYLATRFSSLKGLASIPFEAAIDKHEIAGMVPLLHEVRRGPGKDSRSTPLYFVSASPAQLRPIIERKMLYDGVEFDGTTFKDWWRSVAMLRPARLREQVGFKVAALCALRRELPPGAREVLLGDDLETDVSSFTLYADALAARLSADEVEQALVRHGVAADDAAALRHELSLLLPLPEPVARIYIRLERTADADAFLDFAPHVIACFDSLQMAVSLFEHGAVSLDGVGRVAADLAAHGVTRAVLGERLGDVCARGLATPATCGRVQASLGAAGHLDGALALPELRAAWRQAASRPVAQPWTPARLLGREA